MLRNVPTRNQSKQYYASENQPLLSCPSSLLHSSDNKEDSIVTISPLKEDNSTRVLKPEITKESLHRNDLLIESLKELKLDLESIRKEHMEKDKYIQELKGELSHKQLQIEELWQKLEISATKLPSNDNNSSDFKQSGKTIELHAQEIYSQVLSIRDILHLQLKTMENIETKRISGDENSTKMTGVLSHQSEEFVGILKTFDEICDSNSLCAKPEMIRDVLSTIFSAMKQNLDYLEHLLESFDKYPEMVDRYEVTVYEKDSIIECQRAIIAVKNDQIEKLQQKLEQVTLNGCSTSEIMKTSMKKQKHLALVDGLMNVVDNILKSLFGNRSLRLEDEHQSHH